MNKEDLELKELGYFTGTEKYHSFGKMYGNAVATDGVKYIMDNGYFWFVIDALTVIKLKLKDEPFLTIKLKLLGKNKAQIIITDGNTKILNTQEYEYTDAKKELTLYFTDNVMLLSSEY
jgi:hypothetical protein